MATAQPTNSERAEASSQAELASALEEIGAITLSPAHRVLFEQGQRPTGVFVVRKGKVRLLFRGERVYRTAGPGTILGLPAAVSNHPYSLTAQALVDCELLQVDRQRLIDLLRVRSDLSLQVVAILADEVRRMRKHASEVASKSKAL